MKKKVFKRFFLAISKIKKAGLQNIFSGDVQQGNTKKVFANFPRGFWRFPTKLLGFKNSAVLKARTAQFSRI